MVMTTSQRVVLLLLLLITLGGAYIRSYHTDYPSIGYHNWKEARYITEARNFARDGFFNYGFFVPALDFMPLTFDPSGAHSDFFPSSAIAASIMFMMFGFKLWAARLPVIIVSVLSIPLMFLIVRRLFGRDDMALVAAALTAINPMFAFYSHNVDQMPFGLFFVLLSWVLIFKWIDQDKWYFLLGSSFFAGIAVATKYTYGLMLLPYLAILPYECLKEWKPRLKTILAAAVLVGLGPGWWFYTSYVIPAQFGGPAEGGGDTVSLKWLLDAEVYQSMKPYAADNYTLVGVLFAAVGLTLFIIMRKRFSPMCRRFFLMYGCCVPLLPILIGRQLGGHSYHQFPAAPFLIICIAYLFTVIAVTAERYIKFSYLRPIVLVLLFFVPVPLFSYAVQGLGSHTLFYSSMEATNRQFDTQFYGLDVAGNYIKTHKKPGDRILHSSHQAYGILWHGDLKGNPSVHISVEDMKRAETERNVSWIFIYQWDFDIFQNPDDAATLDYFTKNYRLTQVGFMSQNGQNAPLYLLLRKGGNFSINDLGSAVQGKPVRTQDYELTRGTVQMQYVNVEP